jgi:inhibitor of KinA
MTWIPYGPNALLLRFADKIGDEAFVKSRAIISELERHPPIGLVEFVPAFTTILLEFDSEKSFEPDSIASALLSQLEAATDMEFRSPLPHEVPVIYDGPDLERVAELGQLTISEVCALHAATLYKVYMLGFSPGFPYLGDLDPRLHTPRLASPRTRVPAGSVAIGGEHTGIYSVDSPGGWNIIGHTTLKIFDPQRAQSGGREEEMFLLRPGNRVRFVAVEK